MSKTAIIIAIIALLAIGGKILFPAKHPEPVGVTPNEETPSRAVMTGPQKPPPVEVLPDTNK